MDVNLSFYDRKAAQLAEQYDSVDFESVHNSWRSYWPLSGSSVLDVGAGSGRDAKWFDSHGCKVVAIEPSAGFRQLGQQRTSTEVHWLDAQLPDISSLDAISHSFDLILVSAVWMHIPVPKRYQSLCSLVERLAEGGRIVITLRHGAFCDGRTSYGVSLAELEQIAQRLDLVICHVAETEDGLSRTGVAWQTVVLEKAPSVRKRK
ncbi:class I SAM-dependent methyltransferase [Vibrio paucivorans]|uniref:Class I SAM-dependent methyltransferase n=1 Tax=Vibrio paucivorans TaxID=2829489 RepID=A0A9X3CE85_9VIBR|nr:class I SAM-dependent methyltransferase [Vibrio paucivorans]MCW8334087.1 class I SAM-dependent methyltransferase [Vibrio paucivorans]